MRASGCTQRVVPFLAVVLVGGAAALGGCNAVLGIDPARLASVDGGEASADGAAAADADGGVEGNETGADAAPADPLTCENYCNVVTQNCSGEYAEYLASADGGTVCLDVCRTYLLTLSNAYYPYPGVEPTESQPALLNSLGCRLWHAHAAAAADNGGPAVHCRHAGLLGSEVCGGPIAGFCGLDYQYCTDNSGVSVYSTVAACEATLGAVLGGDGGFYRQDSGDLKDDSLHDIESGNTLNCRLWHLEYAISQGQPRTHCPHTGLPSVDVGGGQAPCQ